MSDTPTQRFDSPPPPPTSGRSRVPLILAIVGGVLLIAVILLLVLLLGRGTGSPDAAGTNSPIATNTAGGVSTPVPVPTVTVTETPPPNGNTGGGGGTGKPNGTNVLITEYSITPSTIKCSAGQTALHITWKSVNGNIAFFGVNTVDAQAGGMGWNLPASGSDHDFGTFGAYPYKVSCGTSPNNYTITVNGNGSKQSLTITLKQIP